MDKEIFKRYIYVNSADLTVLIEQNLRDLYAYKKAYAIAYNILFDFPLVINLSMIEKDMEIQKFKCLAAFREIDVTVTEENVEVTLNDIIRVVSEIFENNILMVSSSDFDPYSNACENKRDKMEIVAQLKADLNKVIAGLDEESLSLKRNKN